MYVTYMHVYVHVHQRLTALYIIINRRQHYVNTTLYSQLHLSYGLLSLNVFITDIISYYIHVLYIVHVQLYIPVHVHVYV